MRSTKSTNKLLSLLVGHWQQCWGKKKKAVDGYSQVGYSTFLGYDKYENAKIGLKVNEEQVEVVRFIYREFLKGKSVNKIS